MKCKDIEISISSENPFAEDRLNRQPLASNLTDIANLYSDTGAVIALDGEWGAGKTTFVRMWKQMLENAKYKTIYFNVWNSDFHDDPFIALISELNEIFKKSPKFKNVVASGAKLGLKVVGEVAKGFIKEYLKRFFDIEYALPAPDMEEYSKFLYKAYEFENFFEHDCRIRERDLQSEGDMFKRLSSDLMVASHVSLRTANKIFAYTRLALCGYNLTQHFSADLFFLLCFFKITNLNFYNIIKRGELSIQDLLKELEFNLPEDLFNPNEMSFAMHHISYAVAALLIQYNFIQRGLPRESNFKNLTTDANASPKYPIKTSKIDLNQLNEALDYESKNRYNQLGLKMVFDKIDLLDTIKITGAN